ncbi:hypothetical protein GGQ99_004780 [Aminobacter niigataensis]|uniref:Uncharacterized protein n=1 Tax=Aminobacter niigataensis TaxID=83265 RepID=A0ABR6LAM1_9HYPH|nr:hypothetical protein [Aminobacter niigataensis]MBB4652996.1 hypothetical protein [Aminobacter niigataensis]
MKKLLTEMTIDEYNADIIANAAYFTACRKTGVGRYDKREAPTQDAIRTIAAEMGRGTIIYAIGPTGRQAFVDTIR